MTDSFGAEVAELAPAVRRYCARLTGSLFDGDDLAQDTLATALAKRELLMDGAPLKPWVFRIAYNKCIDHLRRSQRWHSEEIDEETQASPGIQQAESKPAMNKLVSRLPPRQRAMLILKEVFSFSLEEIGTALGCSIDAVKSGIKRARQNLDDNLPERPVDPGELELVSRYARLFDQGDWDGLLGIISSEVQLDVSTIYCGLGADKVVNRYFTNYSRFDFPWRVTPARLPSGICALSWRMDREQPELFGVMRLRIDQESVVQVTDYLHDADMLAAVEEELRERGIEQYFPSAAAIPVRGTPAPLPANP